MFYLIFYSTATEVGKFVSGSLTDVQIGQNITATGKTNSDGSVTAQSLQIRPAVSANPTNTDRQ